MSNNWHLHIGDNLEALRAMPDNSVDAVVTDPPYGLGTPPDPMAMLQAWLGDGAMQVKGRGFMGKEWDAFVPQPATWREVYRVLKPGGHVVAFAGTRTQDLMALSLRIAGFEIRDMLAWVSGSGFPKSLDIGKALDKAAGAEREVLERRAVRVWFDTECQGGGGWSAGEVLITAPATDAAKQWHGWGTALKPALETITLARKPLDGTVAANVLRWGVGGLNVDGCRTDGAGAGRWPANLLHDGSQLVLDLFPETKQDESPARFFYCAKASPSERHHGLPAGANVHPTVKPIAVMQWLARLVTPPGGLVLDPYTGSGTTGIACLREGFRFVGCELSPEYAAIAQARIAHEQQQNAKQPVVKTGKEG